jgi:hypothetical protein
VRSVVRRRYFSVMRHTALILVISMFAAAPPQSAEVRVPAFTAYIAPDPEGARVSREHGVSEWQQPGTGILWFGEFKAAGKLSASVALRLPKGDSLALRLTVGDRTGAAMARGGDGEVRVSLGEFNVAVPGYLRFDLVPLGAAVPGVEISALILDGEPVTGAHFNLDARRNAASVHLRFPTDSTAQVIGFYNEVTAVDDPVTTYYMATGFSRGYFGMQVNSPTERRIIFSVWDAANGSTARDRSTVAADDQTQLVARGDGVEASVFGNEGTGGHSHLVYNWTTGSVQKFYVTATPDGSHTVYSGYWFHPDRQQWQLIASFRAAKDGGMLRRLYAFSEDFGGETGHLRRKALFGPQWIRLADGRWQELTTATFSHDATGREHRTDRFMGVEGGRFFLSHGGFVPGFTTSGAVFTRPASGKAPEIKLP